MNRVLEEAGNLWSSQLASPGRLTLWVSLGKCDLRHAFSACCTWSGRRNGALDNSASPAWNRVPTHTVDSGDGEKCLWFAPFREVL